MTNWTTDELHKIGNTEELRLASLSNDGALRKPVIIWVVRMGDDLYVRSVNGRTSAWFRGVQTLHAGHIRAGGVEKDVTFIEESDPGMNAMLILHMQQSIVIMQQALLAISMALKCGRQPSNWCRAQWVRK